MAFTIQLGESTTIGGVTRTSFSVALPGAAIGLAAANNQPAASAPATIAADGKPAPVVSAAKPKRVEF